MFSFQDFYAIDGVR